MMTPQEVTERKFEKAVFGGYVVTEVDAFLDSLTEDYQALYKENTTLKNKLKVLIDTVEDYRRVDESMRRALANAQKMAEEMVEDARRQSENLLTEAGKNAKVQMDKLQADINKEEMRLKRAKDQTLLFVNSMRELYSKEIDMLGAVPSMEPPKKEVRRDSINEKTKDIEKSVMQSIEREEEEKKTAVVAQATVQAEPKTSDIVTSERTFGFGDDDLSDIWDAQEDTEAPRPRMELPSDFNERFLADTK